MRRIVWLSNGNPGYRDATAAPARCVTTRRANQLSFRILSSPFAKKYFCFSEMQISLYPSPSRPTRGAFRDRHGRGAGMRWTRLALMTRAPGGRRSRVVLTPRRWRQVRGKQAAGDGGKKARSPGRARISRKPLRRECRCFRVTCTNACAFYHYHCTRGRGRIGHPAFPAPSDRRGREIMAKLGRYHAARSRSRVRRHTPNCHRPRRRTIQYSRDTVMELMGRGVLDPPHARGYYEFCFASNDEFTSPPRTSQMPLRDRGASATAPGGSRRCRPPPRACGARPGSRHVVVRAQDVEVAGLQPLQHEVDRLLRRPGAGRLLGAAARGEPGEDEAGDQQMGADPAARGLRSSCCSASVNAFTPALETL